MLYIYTWQRDQDIPSQVVIVFVNLNYDQDELNVWPGSTGVRQFSKDSAARWIRRIIVQVSLCASYFCSSPLLCSTSLNSSRFIPTCTSNATSSFVVKLFFLGFEYDNRNIDQLLLSSLCKSRISVEAVSRLFEREIELARREPSTTKLYHKLTEMWVNFMPRQSQICLW